MADIKLIVDTKSVDRAIDKIDRLRTGVGAASKAQKEYTAAQKQERAATRAYAQARREATEANARFDAQQRKAAQAAKQAADEEKRLKTQFDSNYRASQVYKRELRDLVKAKQRGIITTDRYQQEVQQLKTEFRDFGAQTKGVTALNNRFAAQTQMAGRRTNQLGVLMQQTGYQVGDFAVQVQSGTNVMVALGQQATQLVGTFGMLSKSTKMVGIFAGLGIVVPVVTALAGAFMRSSDNAKTFDDTLSDLESSISNYSSAVKEARANTKDLRERFGNVSETMRPFLADLEELERLKALNNLNSAFEKLEVSSKTFMDGVREALVGNVQAVKVISDRLGLTVDQYKEISLLTQEIKDAETSSDRMSAVNAVRDSLKETFGSLDNMTEEMQSFYLSLVKVVVAGGELKGETQKAADTAGKITQGFANAVGPAKTVRNETEKHISKMAELFKNAQSMREELGDAAYEALRVAGVDMKSGVDAAAKAAARLAADLNISLAAAIAMQNMASKEEQVMSQPVVTGPATDRFGVEDLLGMGYTKEYLKVIGKIRDKAGRGGSDGGGKSPADVARENLEKLREQLKVEQALIGKSEERKRIIKSLGVEFVNQNPEIVNGLETQIQQIDEMAQREQQLKSFGETIKNSLGDAFMSIVDGSKSASDAFKDMARSILKQAFELAVINPIINSIFGGASGFTKLPTLFANGAAFSNGKVTAFADGGVVNQPTMFPMANGAGLMGEAGPEAIMPLKRGKNGKLGVQVEGSQGNVTVENHFHIAANGDDSVKRIIAQEAPKIANLTQKQILDQRRRGGVMKSTFG